MSLRDCKRQHPVDPAGRDAGWMAVALDLARCVERRTWPNPPVGAVVVRDGEIVGWGAHQGAGTPHAEPLALAEAGERARGATLYVTLEPCNHRGRTPPCAPAVFASGVNRVVVAMRDPNPQVTGGGCRHLRERGLTVDCGVLASEALELVWPFVATDSFARPYVELKTAHSLDGWFAPPASARTPGTPWYLTGQAARHDVHRRRRRVDLVLVGERTVAADRPRLDGRLAATDRDVPGEDPVPGYVDTDLSWTGGFARGGYVVFAGESARGSAQADRAATDGGRVVFCRERDGRVDLADLRAKAGQAGFFTLMVEGGPRLAGAMLRAGVVDRWLRYEAPVILGGGTGWEDGFLPVGVGEPAFSLTGTHAVGADVLTVHDRRDFQAALDRVTI